MRGSFGPLRRALVVGAAVLVTLSALLVSPAGAASPEDLDPEATPSLGVLNPGATTVDTTALTMTGPGTSFVGVDVDGAAVFDFTPITVSPGVTIRAVGSRPLALLSRSTTTIDGVIDATGENAEVFDVGPNPGGPGGGAGGTAGSAGSGPGGGGPGSGSGQGSGGGGGGFGGIGARGGPGLPPPIPGGAGGTSYGDLATLLEGGSGGGSGSGSGFSDLTTGGGGGGAVALVATVSVVVGAGGQVDASGGSGEESGQGASGGGSGGGLYVEAPNVNVSGTVRADGGDGGRGGCCGDGGGGGGGRIRLVGDNVALPPSGTLSVAGGLSGEAGFLAHGFLSPDLAGGVGVITFAELEPEPGVDGQPVCVKTKTDWRAPYKDGTCPSGFTLHRVATTSSSGLDVCTKTALDWRAPDRNDLCPGGFTRYHVVTVETGGLPVCVKTDLDWRAPYKDGTCPSSSSRFRIKDITT